MGRVRMDKTRTLVPVKINTWDRIVKVHSLCILSIYILDNNLIAVAVTFKITFH